MNLGCVDLDKSGIQSSEKRLVRGLVKFVPALACLFCLALLGTCLVESAYLISEPCILNLYHSDICIQLQTVHKRRLEFRGCEINMCFLLQTTLVTKLTMAFYRDCQNIFSRLRDHYKKLS